MFASFTPNTETRGEEKYLRAHDDDDDDDEEEEEEEKEGAFSLKVL